MSPFHVYYGRQTNNVLLAQSTRPFHDLINTAGGANIYFPSKRQRDLFEKQRARVRKRAKKATKCCNEQMIHRACTANPPSIYNVKDEVLVRIHCKTHKMTKKHAILNGIIVKRNLRLSKYKVRFTPLEKSGFSVRWFSVTDISSVTRDEERRRQK